MKCYHCKLPHEKTERSNKLLNLCIISPNKISPNETFITAHKQLLTANKFCLYGGAFPTESENEGSLIKIPSFVNRQIRKIEKIFFNKIYPEARIEGLIKYLTEKKIDVVLAEYGVTAAEIYPICKKLNIPLIVHFHGYDAYVYKLLKKYEHKYKEMFNYASAIIAVSYKMKIQLEKLGASPDKVKINTYGANYMFKEIKPNYKSNKLVAIGRFVDKKAPYYTLLAFREAQKKHKELKLIMGGTGYLMNSIQNLVQLWKLQNNVELCGQLKHDEVANIFSNSFCFIQHSIAASNGDSEGTPVSIIEAQTAALPVISTIHAGIPDVVKDKKTGLLVKEHDVEGMTKAICKLAEDREMAEKYGKEGRKNALENFSMDKHIQRLQNILENTVC